MYSNFTPEAVAVIERAEKETRTLQHECLGTEHILLALIGDRESLTCKLLRALPRPVNVDELETTIRGRLTQGETPVQLKRPHKTPRFTRVIELATLKANAQGKTKIREEHLLMGLIAESGGLAGKVLRDQEKVTVADIEQGLPAFRNPE